METKTTPRKGLTLDETFDAIRARQDRLLEAVEQLQAALDALKKAAVLKDQAPEAERADTGPKGPVEPDG